MNRRGTFDMRAPSYFVSLVSCCERVESLLLLVIHFRTFITTVVRHRFERIIAGRSFVIEVTWVAEKRWRAHIVRIPGVPTAMMPFYGETPDEAATQPEQLARPRAPASGEYGIVRRARSACYVLCASVLAWSLSCCGAVGGIDTWADNELPRITFLATGGTIATRGGTRHERRRSPPAGAGAAALRAARARAIRQRRQHRHDARPVGAAGQARQRGVRRTIPGLTGAVITSGTDSLEELAYFLHLTVKTTKPVVLVGAMRNAGAPGYEGPANLLDAFRVAASADSRGKGVLVVLNDEINSAREVTKTDALRVQTFQSRPYGILGVVDPDRVVYYREPVKRHTQQSRVRCLDAVTSLPRVDIMMFYQGASSDLLRAAVDAGAKGIVIAVAGADLTGGSLAPGIAYAERQGVVVVAATRTGSGRIAALVSEPCARRADRRRRPDAAEGAHPADARADEDAVRRRHSADVYTICNARIPATR